MRNDVGRFEPEKTLLNGAWFHLKNEFKNRDFFHDLMMRLSSDFPRDKYGDLPRFPISCLIDYCGFRVLCESDIYVEDGGSACGIRRFDQMNSMKDNEPAIFRDIANVR